jgi:hypothetical protein
VNAVAAVVGAFGNRWLAAAAAVGMGALVGVSAARGPEITWGIVAGPLVAAILLTFLVRHVAAHPAAVSLLPVLAAGIVLRTLFALVHIAVGLWIYGGAIDFMGYIEQAQFSAPDMVVRLVAAMMLVCGPNVLGLFSVCVALSSISAYLFLRAFETAFPRATAQRFPRLVFFLFPAVGFWSVFLGKDVWVFFALALATYCFAHLLQRVSLRHVAGLLAGIALAFTIRGPVAAGLAAAVVVGIAMRPLRWQGWLGYLRPLHRIALVAIFGVAASGLAAAALLRYGVEAVTLEALAERAYAQHQGFALTEAGSQLPVALQSGDPSAVLAYLPIGLFTLFFRPLPWEAHNALALFASVENVFFLGLIAVRLPHLVRTVMAAPRQPFLVFALTATLAVAAPLAFQWNLGTMARMRTMALPFFMFLLAGPPRGVRGER